MTQPASTPTDTAAQHDNASRHPVSGTFPATNSFIPALEELADEFREWELEMRRSGRCDADVAVCKQLTQRLFREVDAVERLVRGGDLDMSVARQEVDRVLMPLLCRSPLYWRSRFKPHGYAGDYQIIEQMYDLERGFGRVDTQPAFLNALAYP